MSDVTMFHFARLLKGVGFVGLETFRWHWAQVPLVTPEGAISGRPPKPALPLAKSTSTSAEVHFAKPRDGTAICHAWQKGRCSQQKERPFLKRLIPMNLRKNCAKQKLSKTHWRTSGHGKKIGCVFDVRA